MKTYTNPVHITESMAVKPGRLTVFAGPCAAESYELCADVAGHVKEICAKLDINYVFKASFDKANRTSADSYRGPSIDAGLGILQMVRDNIGVPVITDVHESAQCSDVAAVVDVIQIPAFLCRQTDLLVAAGQTGKVVNIKKGQFMAPEDMSYAIEKVREAGNEKVVLTERGSSFGYRNLVVDMRSLPVMRQFAPVVFDATHSVQRPGGLGGSSGGDRQFVPYLASAAAAAGVDGFFIETHPNPDKALSDGPNMVPLAQLEELLTRLVRIWRLTTRSDS